ncbi:hypothetical protein Celaphus_00016909, partial [Cervus elaphus hippelaphus]
MPGEEGKGPGANDPSPRKDPSPGQEPLPGQELPPKEDSSSGQKPSAGPGSMPSKDSPSCKEPSDLPAGQEPSPGQEPLISKDLPALQEPPAQDLPPRQDNSLRRRTHSEGSLLQENRGPCFSSDTTLHCSDGEGTASAWAMPSPRTLKKELGRNGGSMHHLSLFFTGHRK